ncbi:MAG: hypothetical protein KC731_03945 [Myxococcales bacterium]|nr:hypothetical protein [Myxococcales bacterium]
MLRASLLLVAGLALGGCLPDDLRDPPAAVLFTAAPSDATRDGFRTDDGWDVRFDTFALTLGRVGFQNSDECSRYSFTYYDWLIDFTKAKREKVGLIHGLGFCSFRLASESIDGETRLGAGATSALRDEMGWANVRVEGVATREGEVKRFDFSLIRPTQLGPCLYDGFGVDYRFLLPDEEVEVELEVRGEGLFAHFPGDEPLFERFAVADSDFDGVLTDDEVDGLFSPVGYNEWTFSPLGVVVAPRDGFGCADDG